MAALRAGVIGAGVFGGYHASKYAADDRVELTAVYDRNPERAEALAQKHGVIACDDVDAFLEHCDAVTVASSAPSHGEMALAALMAGKHVLVEKPIATELRQAEAVVAAAAERNLVLQVGHQERFVFSAIGLFEAPETPVLVEARRRNLFNERGTDVSVTLDLMIHDLDLSRRISGRAPVDEMQSRTRSSRTPFADEADARLIFENGVEAILHASRLAETLERTMRVTYPSGVVEVDFVNKTFSNTTPFALNENFAQTEQARDSLGEGVKAFLSAILEGGRIRVSGEDGLEALRAALLIDGVGVFAE